MIKILIFITFLLSSFSNYAMYNPKGYKIAIQRLQGKCKPATPENVARYQLHLRHAVADGKADAISDLYSYVFFRTPYDAAAKTVIVPSIVRLSRINNDEGLAALAYIFVDDPVYKKEYAGMVSVINAVLRAKQTYGDYLRSRWRDHNNPIVEAAITRAQQDGNVMPLLTLQDDKKYQPYIGQLALAVSDIMHNNARHNSEHSQQQIQNSSQQVAAQSSAPADAMVQDWDPFAQLQEALRTGDVDMLLQLQPLFEGTEQESQIEILLTRLGVHSSPKRMRLSYEDI